MRVLFTSLRTTSHFLPLVPFIEACKRRGHEVAVAAPSDLADQVARTDATFFPFGHPGDSVLKPIWARLRTATPEESKRIVVGEIFAGATAAAAIPGLIETIARWRPDVIVRESQEYAAIVVAERAGIPHARVAITLSGGEAEIFAIAAASIDRHRASLDLPLDPSGERVFQAPALTLLPAGLEFPNAAAGHIRRFRAMRRPPAALPAWWGVEEQRPLLYVTLGTVAGSMDVTHAAYRAAIDAAGTLPARVLLTTGSDLSSDVLGEIPANVHVERFVPQDDVFPHAAAVLCHGGSGTVLGALAAGVPLVVTPLFADQPQNAERVAATGAGLVLDGRSLQTADLRKALARVLDEASFRSVAGRFAEEIAALPSMDEAAVEIEAIARGNGTQTG